jgi:hypothetical protein
VGLFAGALLLLASVDLSTLPLGVPWIVLTVVATVLGAASVWLVARRTGGRRLLAGAGAALSVAWWLAVIAVWTDWRDADGWVDCHPNCDAVHYAAGGTLSYGAVAIVLVASSIVVTEFPVLGRLAKH